MLVLFQGGPLDGESFELPEHARVHRTGSGGISHFYAHSDTFDSTGRAIFVWDPSRSRPRP
jgi:hypothetical protein